MKVVHQSPRIVSKVAAWTAPLGFLKLGASDQVVCFHSCPGEAPLAANLIIHFKHTFEKQQPTSDPRPFLHGRLLMAQPPLRVKAVAKLAAGTPSLTAWGTPGQQLGMRTAGAGVVPKPSGRPH